MDNELRLAFLISVRKALLEKNMEKLPDCSGNAIKENYSQLVTNINTNALNSMDRIINFLSAAHVQYDCTVVVKDDNQSHSRIDSIIQ